MEVSPGGKGVSPPLHGKPAKMEGLQQLVVIEAKAATPSTRRLPMATGQEAGTPHVHNEDHAFQSNKLPWRMRQVSHGKRRDIHSLIAKQAALGFDLLHQKLGCIERVKHQQRNAYEFLLAS